MSASELLITLEDIAPLFGHDLGDRLMLIVSPDIRSYLNLTSWNTADCNLVEFNWLGRQSRQDLIEEFFKLQKAGLYCSALWITTDEYEHFASFELKNTKIAALSLFSSPFSITNLQRIWEITKRTNYQLQLETESQILDVLDTARKILFHCPKYGTQAVFHHQDAEYWFSLHGPLEFGQQTVLPTGEISVLTDPSGQFNGKSRFPIEGHLLLQGFPVVHRSHPEVSLSETLELFERLISMRDYPVVARVNKGEIDNIYSPIKGYNPFLYELEQLFLKDSDYRKIHEIGFGTNISCVQLICENFLPNERYPGVHFGLGLGGTTHFHIDLICTSIKVLLENKLDGNMQSLYSKIVR